MRTDLTDMVKCRRTVSAVGMEEAEGQIYHKWWREKTAQTDNMILTQHRRLQCHQSPTGMTASSDYIVYRATELN